MRSGLEIQAALAAFVTKWSGFAGTEKAEAQTFLNELFACYGSDRGEVGALFEDFATSAGFMDLHWPGVLIVEMKAPTVELEKARDQRQRYWLESSNPAAGIPAARWVIACNFREFEIWEPGRFPGEARARFTLAELPDRYDSLLFLQSETIEPVFAEHRRELTTDAARHIADLYTSLADRAAAPIDEIQRFTMQLVWCLFAEDLGMLDGYPLQSTILELLASAQPDSARDIGYLFELLNQKGDHNRQGRYAGTRYVNGELFARPAKVLMTKPELEHLKKASEFDWRAVDPTIFGSLMEGILGDERRERLGAHYTHEADIMKIVAPTIVRPWRDRVDATSTPAEVRALLDELVTFRVLDPACGCGNFLYIAYRELRGLEHELKQRYARLCAEQGEPAAADLPFYPLSNIKGIDIEQVAVMVARITLWMGHRQMVDRFGPAEPVLPLTDLSGVRAIDALQADWPEVDTIIGNPPFVGGGQIRSKLGDEYAEWLKKRFGTGIRDLCTYWFRKAHDQLKPGQRAGLVGTNSVSQNTGRDASLDYVLLRGGVITDAVSSQKWPGDAKVHVSIVNWIKQPTTPVGRFVLDGEEVSGISSSLREVGSTSWRPKTLGPNKGKCFEGPSPKAKDLLISSTQAQSFLSEEEVNRTVVRPYLTAKDITDRVDQSPSRWTIDFGLRTLEEAVRFQSPMAHVRRFVKPIREKNNRKIYRDLWWLFAEPRRAMRAALDGKYRYVAVAGHAKRLTVTWQAPWTLASNATNVFAFDDDYSMGILLSKAHDAWAWTQSSTLETRLRYTPTTVFETFPWPDPVSDDQRHAVATAASDLYARRSELCLEHNMGLTALYNLMDAGGFTDLAVLHKKLDVAVAAAYGWPASVAQDPIELVTRLTGLNREIVEGGRPYNPFTS
ncbi:DNA methyltransferase [Microcella sp.]|uniref:DNA methyltransferase n=1 Tax=Microcella sp. TaxID=1913979 RepID=UPI00299F8271|nr:DNA methyltransferase [Microcella sp.]MDX2025041.1 type IIL restriction-modification enzyme MmeI [Microcella sp.]